MSNEVKKETAIQNEQQLKSKQEIVKEVLNVLFQNKEMSFYYGKQILCDAIDALGTTPIMYK